MGVKWWIVAAGLAACLTALAAIPANGQAPSAADASAFKTRVTLTAALSQDDLARLVEEVGRALEGRAVHVREGSLTRRITDGERLGVFAMLMGRLPVADAGPKVIEGSAVRGIRAPATPPNSEVDASQFLWVDVLTLLPKRYELSFSVPGMGDGFVDFTYDE